MPKNTFQYALFLYTSLHFLHSKCNFDEAEVSQFTGARQETEFVAS